MSNWLDQCDAADRRRASMPPIRQRIDTAYDAANRGMTIVTLAHHVFPHDVYPRAWQHAAKGGPPAWTRVLHQALKRYGYHVSVHGNVTRTSSWSPIVPAVAPRRH
jgi:hypothetical protein